MNARRNGPMEMLTSVFLLQMLSKTSVDEVFMHHFEKNVVSFWGLAPRPPLGAAFRPPHCPPAGAHEPIIIIIIIMEFLVRLLH